MSVPSATGRISPWARQLCREGPPGLTPIQVAREESQRRDDHGRDLDATVTGPCWAGPPARSATTASVCTAIAPGCWRRSTTRPNRAGRACARPTGFGWVRPAGAGAGTARPKRARPEYMYGLGAGVARTPRGARSGHRAAGGWATGSTPRRGRVTSSAGARLGDARLSARLVQSAQQMAESPMRAITGAANGARALVKGHYRLIDQPADSAVTVDNILAPHRERSPSRRRGHTMSHSRSGTQAGFSSPVITTSPSTSSSRSSSPTEAGTSATTCSRWASTCWPPCC